MNRRREKGYEREERGGLRERKRKEESPRVTKGKKVRKEME